MHVPRKDELVVFNFYSDLNNHSGISDYVLSLQETIKEGITGLVKQAHLWKKYRALWKMQKVNGLLVEMEMCIYFPIPFID